MKFDLDIPPFLEHLKRDERGYPIPYFVGYVNGKPDFRLLDNEKQKICCNYRKCAICGRKMERRKYYFLSGPMGCINQVSTDPPMHKECAEFSLFACPHLYYEKAARRDTGLAPVQDYIQANPGMVLSKPNVMMLVHASDYTLKGNMIKYKRENFTVYGYYDGVIKEVNAGDEIMLQYRKQYQHK